MDGETVVCFVGVTWVKNAYDLFVLGRYLAWSARSNRQEARPAVGGETKDHLYIPLTSTLQYEVQQGTYCTFI